MYHFSIKHYSIVKNLSGCECFGCRKNPGISYLQLGQIEVMKKPSYLTYF